MSGRFGGRASECSGSRDMAMDAQYDVTIRTKGEGKKETHIIEALHDHDARVKALKMFPGATLVSVYIKKVR